MTYVEYAARGFERDGRKGDDLAIALLRLLRAVASEAPYARTLSGQIDAPDRWRRRAPVEAARPVA